MINAVRWLVKIGVHWQHTRNSFLSWPAVHQQAQRWLAVGCFEATLHELREITRVDWTGYDGYERRRGHGDGGSHLTETAWLQVELLDRVADDWTAIDEFADFAGGFDLCQPSTVIATFKTAASFPSPLWYWIR